MMAQQIGFFGVIFLLPKILVVSTVTAYRNVFRAIKNEWISTDERES